MEFHFTKKKKTAIVMLQMIQKNFTELRRSKFKTGCLIVKVLICCSGCTYLLQDCPEDVKFILTFSETEVRKYWFDFN
jgi:hypothetical protein